MMRGADNWRRWRCCAWLALAGLLAQPLPALAQGASDDQIVRPGDTLRLEVPGRPELDQDLTVNAAGNVEVAQIGSVQLGGLTLSEARLLLRQRLRLIHPTLDSLSLELGRAGTLRIYILGQVGRPGMQSFEEIPSLWDVVRSAGGPIKGADLRGARVIREEREGPKVYPVNLSGLLSGELLPAFTLQDGDTLVIPLLPEGVSGVPVAEGVKVFGGVSKPAVVAVDGPTPLLDVLMLAGSPTADADLAKIWWVHREGDRDLANLVNLKSYLEIGDPAGNPVLYPGDTVRVGLARPGFWRQTLPLVLGTLTAAATVYLAINQATE